MNPFLIPDTEMWLAFSDRLRSHTFTRYHYSQVKVKNGLNELMPAVIMWSRWFSNFIFHSQISGSSSVIYEAYLCCINRSQCCCFWRFHTANSQSQKQAEQFKSPLNNQQESVKSTIKYFTQVQWFPKLERGDLKNLITFFPISANWKWESVICLYLAWTKVKLTNTHFLAYCLTVLWFLGCFFFFFPAFTYECLCGAVRIYLSTSKNSGGYQSLVPLFWGSQAEVFEWSYSGRHRLKSRPPVELQHKDLNFRLKKVIRRIITRSMWR